MTNTSDNVRVAVTGLVAVGPTTADAPTSSASVLDTDFDEVGYIGEAGVTEKRERSTKDIKGWQGATTVRTIVTDSKMTWTFPLLETNAAALELFYGTTTAGATSTDGRLDVDPASTGGRRSFVLDVVDGDEAERTYVQSGEVTEVGDVVYSSGDATIREVTITGYPVNGVVAKKWSTALKTVG